MQGPCADASVSGDLPNDMRVMDFSEMLAERGIILFEDGRSFQRQEIQKLYGPRANVYLKHEAFRTTLILRKTGARTKNKPLHLYVFEPDGFEGLRLRSSHFWNQSLWRTQNRMARLIPARVRRKGSQ